MSNASDPFKEVIEARNARIEEHQALRDSQHFKDGINYLNGLRDDFLIAQTSIRLQGSRFNASDKYLLFRFAPHLVEAVLAVSANANEGLQNAARRELRFLLEASVKLSIQDSRPGIETIEERLSGLDNRSLKFEDYVAELKIIDEFESPDELRGEILSLYSRLSTYVHAASIQFSETVRKNNHGEGIGEESVKTLLAFGKLTFQVYDIVLVLLFPTVGIGVAGDIFTTMLDDMPKWRFHRGKYVSRLSKCFDYKFERQQRLKRLSEKDI